MVRYNLLYRALQIEPQNRDARLTKTISRWTRYLEANAPHLLTQLKLSYMQSEQFLSISPLEIPVTIASEDLNNRSIQISTPAGDLIHGMLSVRAASIDRAFVSVSSTYMPNNPFQDDTPGTTLPEPWVRYLSVAAFTYLVDPDIEFSPLELNLPIEL